jgi:hypothetical protein
VKRTELRAGAVKTPWGTADFATEYAPGITFFETPGHGGFCLSPERNAEVLAKFPGFRPFSGAVGWYEEDCDWSAVALTFPDLFPGFLVQAQACFDKYCAKRMTKEVTLASFKLPVIPRRNEEGVDWICTGNFDGFTCGSDADSGL